MRAIYICIVMLLMPALVSVPMSAKVESPDTVCNVEIPSRVTIMENPEGTTVNIESLEGMLLESLATPYQPESSVSARKSYRRKSDWFGDGSLFGYSNSKGKSSYWGVGLDGVCIGLTDAVGQGGRDGFEWSKSFEVCWMNCLKVYYRFSRSCVSLGLGLDWRNYRCTFPGRELAVNAEGGLEWAEPVRKTKFTRLQVFSLQVPLLYEWRVPKSDLKLKAGPVLCFNTGASAKTSYYDDNADILEVSATDPSRRKVTVDFYGGVTYCGFLGIYVRYSPMKVMKAPGLNFRPLTLGLSIGM